MWRDFLDSLAKLFGRGPRRFSFDPVYEAERQARSRRLRLLALAGIPLLVVAIFSLPKLGRALNGWRAAGLAREATVAVEQRQFELASRKVTEAAMLAPEHPEVALARARWASASSQSEAVAAWQRVLKLRPTTGEYIVELARALSLEGRYAEAERTLGQAGAARSSARGSWISGLLAAQRDEKEPAEALLRASLQAGLGAEANEARLTLAGLLIAGPRNAEGRTLLEGLRHDPVVGRRALGLLVQQAQQCGERERAFQLARALATPPAGQPGDYVRLAAMLVEANDWPGLEDFLESAQAVARSDRKVAAALLDGLVALQRSVQADGWLADLPVEIWTSAEVVPAAARMTAREARREGLLRDLLRRGDWTGHELLKAACVARLAEFEKEARARLDRWERAKLVAGADRAKLRELAALAGDWHWPREQFQIQGTLAMLSDASQEEVRTWWAAARKQRDTSAVASATRLLLTAGDYSAPVKADFIRTSLLLRQDLDRAHKFAAENYAAEPGSPRAVADYCASLRQKGRAAEAQRLLEIATAGGLAAPELDFEGAAIFSALGRKEMTVSYLARLPAEAWPMFPEEEALIARLRSP